MRKSVSLLASYVFGSLAVGLFFIIVDTSMSSIAFAEDEDNFQAGTCRQVVLTTACTPVTCVAPYACGAYIDGCPCQ